MQYKVEMYWDELEAWVDVDEDCTLEKVQFSRAGYEKRHPWIPIRIHDTENNVWYNGRGDSRDHGFIIDHPLWPS